MMRPFLSWTVSCSTPSAAIPGGTCCWEMSSRMCGCGEPSCRDMTTSDAVASLTSFQPTMIHDQLFRPDSTEPGDYATLLELVNNTKVKFDIKKDSNAVFDFIHLLYKAYLRTFGLQFFKGEHAPPSSFESVDACRKWMEAHVGAFIDEFVFGVGDASATQTNFFRHPTYSRDELYTYSLRAFSLIIVFQSLHTITSWTG